MKTLTSVDPCCAPAGAALAPDAPPPGASAGALLAWSVRSGLRAGLRTAWILLKILVPVSLAVTLLNYTGVLPYLAGYLREPFALVGLPPETVVPFLTGALLNIYSCIAALGALELTDRQVTILALASLVAHNLLIECAIQHKAGVPVWRTALLRLVMAVAAAALLHQVLPEGDPTPRARVLANGVPANLPALLRQWAVGTAWLGGKVLVIVTALMIFQRALRAFGLVAVISRLLGPLLVVLGLPRRTAFLWIVANTLGLAYGGGILIEEVRAGQVSPREAQLLNRSVAICHSLLEDTLLLVAIGAWPFWITVPRVLLAAVVVWVYRLATAGRRYPSAATGG